jgi:signal peptidase I
VAAPAEGQGGTERVELRFPTAERASSPLAAVVELVVIVALALGLTWLVQNYVVKSYRVPTGSMRPTIDEGDRVLAARFLSWFSDPERGDVIVFHPPGVACRTLSEPYARSYTDDFGPVTVPRGSYFMLGDNRVNSEDSRIWGTLPKGNVIGTAFVRYWPPRRFGIL